MESKNKKFINLFQSLASVGVGAFGSCDKVIHYDSGLVIVQKQSKVYSDKIEKYLKGESDILK